MPNNAETIAYLRHRCGASRVPWVYRIIALFTVAHVFREGETHE